MKAISLKQPWANLVANGTKTIETRTWKTDYRGPVLNVSSLKPDIYPAGYALSVVDIVGCRRMTVEDEDRAYCLLYPNAWSWLLENNRRIKPVRVKGALRIFNVDIDVEDLEFIGDDNA